MTVFAFSSLNKSCLCLLAYVIFHAKSAVNLIEDLLYVMCWCVCDELLLPCCIQIISLSLAFGSLIMLCLDVDLFKFVLLGACWAFWMYRLMLLSYLRILGHYLFKCSSSLFLSLSSLCATYAYIGNIFGFLQASKFCSYFSFFSFCYLDWIIDLSSYFLIIFNTPLFMFPDSFPHLLKSVFKLL